MGSNYKVFSCEENVKAFQLPRLWTFIESRLEGAIVLNLISLY